MLLVCWLLFPALLVAVAAGHGLLVRRLSAGAVEPLLVLPVGLMGVVVVSTAATWLGVTAPLAGPLLLVLGGLGLVLGRGDLRTLLDARRRLIGPALLLLAAFACFGASVVLSGQPTFTGYTQIVDIGHQFDIAAYLPVDGRAIPDPRSSSLEIVRKTLDVGYPSGSQAPLGALGRVTSLELAWIYQPYLAVFAAALTLPIFVLLRGLVADRRLRLVAAFAAAQPSLLIGYGQMGGVKEMLGALGIVLAAALLREVLRRPTGARAAVGAAVALAGAFAVLSLTLLPWIGILLLGALLLTARETGARAALRTWVPRWGLVVLLSVPTLVAATRSGAAASTTQSADLGNLATPISRFAAAGVWLTADHRYPLTAHQALTTVGIVLVLALALLGLVVVLRRRETGLGLLAVAGIVAFPVMMWRFGPWVELKTMVISGPIVLCLAMAGAGALLRRRRTAPLSYAAVTALVLFVLAADALRYHDAFLAPYDRLRELEAIGERYDADRTLYPDFDEQAEYLLRRAGAVSPVNPPGGVFGVRQEVLEARGPAQQFAWDLDELQPAFVQTFDQIVQRREAVDSRPPSNYSLVHEGRYFRVWRRTRPAGETTHAPLSGTGSPEDAAACRTFARRALRAGEAVRLAPASRVVTANPGAGSVSTGWQAASPSALVVRGPGRADVPVEVPRAGRYRVFLGTTGIRAVDVRVDDRPVGTASHELSYPGGVVPVGGEVQLTRGTHAVSLVRGGGSLAPGNGDGPGRSLGPVWLVPVGDALPPLEQLTRTDAAQRCDAGPVDWIEASR